MKLSHTGKVRALAVLGCVLVMGYGVSAPAAEILSGGANIEASQVYMAETWNIPAGTGVNSSTFVAYGTPYPDMVWQYTGDIEWTGNALINDYSTGSGQARGEFGAGGTFKINGSVLNQSNAPVPGYQNVNLITGTVSGFTVEESGDATNNFDSILPPILTITGGALTGAGAQFTQVGAHYRLDVSMISAVNGGPSIDDFTNSPYVFVNGGTQVNMVLVPEPASVALLVLGGAFAVLKRRR